MKQLAVPWTLHSGLTLDAVRVQRANHHTLTARRPEHFDDTHLKSRKSAAHGFALHAYEGEGRPSVLVMPSS
jgi:hypothetical protein|nr:hypothetical protein [Paraburkholderia sp. BL8N3]